jgi:hypothetical protein
MSEQYDAAAEVITDFPCHENCKTCIEKIIAIQLNEVKSNIKCSFAYSSTKP